MSKPKQKPKVKVSRSNSHLWADRTPKNSPIVAVRWRDIQGIDNWNEDDEVAPARSVLSIGYMLYEGPDPKDPTQKMTVIARTYVEDTSEWADFYAFPTSVIRSMTKIKAAK